MGIKRYNSFTLVIKYMPEIDDKNKTISFSPEELMLGAFEEEKLPLQRLINWGQMGGSPSPDTTQGVLASLVELKVLKWERDENGTVLFSKVVEPKSKIN